MCMGPATGPSEAVDVCSWTRHISIKEGIMFSVENAPDGTSVHLKQGGLSTAKGVSGMSLVDQLLFYDYFQRHYV